METISAEEFKKRYGAQGTAAFGTAQPEKKPNYFQRVWGQFKQAGQSAITETQSAAKDIGNPQNLATGGGIKRLAETGLRQAGNVAGAAFAPITQLPGVSQAVGGIVKGTAAVTDKLSGRSLMDDISATVADYQKLKQKYPNATADAEATAKIAALLTANKGSTKLEEIPGKVKQGAQYIEGKAQSAYEAVKEKAPQLYDKARGITNPAPPTPEGAMGQVLQGKPGDIRAGMKALKEVDTTGVKTYADLETKINDSIKNLSQQVDETLGQNSKLYKLNELQLSGKSTAGKTVKVDYIKRGMENLKELYTSTGDDIAAQNIDDLLKTAQQQGLTYKQVNDLARQYGQEFGQKAFSKMGDPLTSVNAQRFENTRTGLKAVARQGLEGSKAAATDKTISSLYKVQDLVGKNVEAVNKLVQKIQERGLLEKIGYGATKAVDTLTGGSLRGVMGGLLPRGVGYKVMNALDLEKVLQRNLEIIKKAIESGSDDAIMKIANTLGGGGGSAGVSVSDIVKENVAHGATTPGKAVGKMLPNELTAAPNIPSFTKNGIFNSKEAIKFGLANKGNIVVMQELQRQLDRVKGLVSEMSKNGSSGLQSGAYQLGQQAQGLREALEAASNSGSVGTFLKSKPNL